MQLKQIKLAGFKSFVEPTTIPFPSQLIAVVGPNGCGKSNLIDAIRWVMGESSAKNLRGEAMTDVIFNGASARKAVGQASVELIFDNTFGHLPGQYGNYQEISVKRLVTREGESSYYLNGSRCRKRDVTDLFLGTGSGSRSYSIIGQGTISRLIDARPEELKSYLDEVAGVSKYKERRRETMSRLEQTDENLQRVTDIRVELGKYLSKLEAQAKAAISYKVLKTEQRLYRAEILALKWHALIQEQALKRNELNALDTELGKKKIKCAEYEQQIIHMRKTLQEINIGLHQSQTAFYQLDTQIARFKEISRQREVELVRLIEEKKQTQNEWDSAKKKYNIAKNNKKTYQKSLADLEKTWQAQALALKDQKKWIAEKKQQQSYQQTKLDEIQAELSKSLREREIEIIHLQHYTGQYQQNVSRLQQITQEINAIQEAPLLALIQSKNEVLGKIKEELNCAEGGYQQSVVSGNQLRQQLNETETLLHQTQDELQYLNTQQASLAAAQAVILKRTSSQSFSDQSETLPSLVEMIQVEKAWQYACEVVFAESLQARVLNSTEDLFTVIKALSTNTPLLYTTRQKTPKTRRYPTLAEKIKGPLPSWFLSFDKIYAATNLSEAMEWIPGFTADESVVTVDGYWLSKNWAKIARIDSQEGELGIVKRQAKLIQLAKAIPGIQKKVIQLTKQRTELHEKLNKMEHYLAGTERNLLSFREEIRKQESELSAISYELKEFQNRRATLLLDQEKLKLSLQELVDKQKFAEQRIQAYSHQIHLTETQQKHWLAIKLDDDEKLTTQTNAIEEVQQALYANQLQVECENLKLQQVMAILEQEKTENEAFKTRITRLEERSQQLDDPALMLSLTKKENEKRLLEVTLRENQQELENLNAQLSESEINRKSVESQIKNIEEALYQHRLQEKTFEVRSHSIEEALRELDCCIDAVTAGIPPGVTQAMREESVQRVEQKIKDLGSINLIAIEEYQTELQRKQHLDTQYEDLSEAVDLLKKAIETMDAETSNQLEKTFVALNNTFQTLFPRLFGGGNARLLLTENNLLDAGITIMAQPPGKRNNTLQLLSGGEKAMTAVALVFAIFQLNPSPFCLLDEVDAPLDEGNVERFCALVKEMSQVVQFLFITHNKLTMELADHLIGVTMREPGVSRIVSVDVDQALSFAKV